MKGTRCPYYSLFFSFFQNCCRADVQHACGIANATGVHGHINDLLLDLR